jgi:antitoxin component YwqK of YwqJK toxin-antitoxin module
MEEASNTTPTHHRITTDEWIIDVCLKEGKKNGSTIIKDHYGRTIAVITFLDNQKEGQAIFYYPDGKTPQRSCTYVNNRLHGMDQYIDRQGNIIKTILYKNGQIIHDA